MAKIPKNLSDQAMFVDTTEEESFETMVLGEAPAKARQKSKAKEKEDLALSFLTSELQEKIGRCLLELKLELFKEGVVGYDIKVAREGKKIVLSPAVRKKKAEKE